jgi:multidrug resistance protein MdtO
VLFIGFDYRQIYTSVITCFVVSLSTIGSSNQKGILRFGGAAVGGLMGLIALVYLLPNAESIGGFWLVFGAGTAVAAWANFGSPRISYGGYQTGLAFYKAVLQGFGAAASATVLRDRLIGVFFGLAVFGLVEHLLWPVRATDVLRTRFAELLRLLAGLARAGEGRTAAGVDGSRLRISQKVEEIQGLIESSKFEPDARDLDALQKATGEAQIVFLLLLSRARQPRRMEVDSAVAETLDAVAARVAGGLTPPAPDIQNALGEDDSADVYRTLVAALGRLSRSISAAAFTSHPTPATAPPLPRLSTGSGTI